MKINATTHDANWQILGELDLPLGISTDDAVHAWLVDVLPPLNLSPTFGELFLMSVQASARQAFQTITSNGHSHIHILILTPRGQPLAGNSWGFFHIEKIESSADEVNALHYVIDFYLYVEGD